MELFQPHVHPAAKTDLSQSELFLNEEALGEKEKDFVLSVSKKASNELPPKDAKKLKDIARKHVTSSIRVHLWLLLSGGNSFKKSNPTLYSDTREELFGKGDFISDEFHEEKEYLTYYLTEDGGHKLCQVMCIIKHLNPDITFCPLMEPVVSILLHFMSEEDSFACISGLLANKTVPFLAQTKFENIAGDAALQDLLKLSNKKAHTRFESFVSGQQSEQGKHVLFPSWRKMIFEQLNFVCLVRVLDCLLVEGSKILYRVGLFLLEAFYKYSLTFRKLECSSSHDLITTIGQHARSLDVTADALMKDAMKINITTKQIEKCNDENGKLYKLNHLYYPDDIVVNQVVAVDLNQVSDIISPVQWQQVCQWLPARIQIQQPFLLFTTNKDGYNLKTLYLLCEEEEQTLIILHTTTKEIFGAYLSRSLKERHDGRTNLSYFGTGETFIFKLSPDTVCYHWNQEPKYETGSTPCKSKYVFVDTVPLTVNDDSTNGKPVTQKRKKSMKRSLSLTKRTSRSAYTKRDKHVSSLHPLSLINIRRNAASVPKHLYMGKILDTGKSFDDADGSELSHPVDLKTSNKKTLKAAATFDVAYTKQLRREHNISETIDEEYVDVSPKVRSKSESASKHVLTKTKAVLEDECFDATTDETAPTVIGGKKVNFKVGSDETLSKTAELFISCDDARLIIGGGGGEAIWIDGEIGEGRSAKSDTFLNLPLTSGENGDFTVTRMDVFGFQ